MPKKKTVAKRSKRTSKATVKDLPAKKAVRGGGARPVAGKGFGITPLTYTY